MNFEFPPVAFIAELAKRHRFPAFTVLAYDKQYALGDSQPFVTSDQIAKLDKFFSQKKDSPEMAMLKMVWMDRDFKVHCSDFLKDAVEKVIYASKT